MEYIIAAEVVSIEAAVQKRSILCNRERWTFSGLSQDIRG
jgi:hypothetical protein